MLARHSKSTDTDRSLVVAMTIDRDRSDADPILSFTTEHECLFLATSASIALSLTPDSARSTDPSIPDASPIKPNARIATSPINDMHVFLRLGLDSMHMRSN